MPFIWDLGVGLEGRSDGAELESEEELSSSELSESLSDEESELESESESESELELDELESFPMVSCFELVCWLVECRSFWRGCTLAVRAEPPGRGSTVRLARFGSGSEAGGPFSIYKPQSSMHLTFFRTLPLNHACYTLLDTARIIRRSYESSRQNRDALGSSTHVTSSPSLMTSTAHESMSSNPSRTSVRSSVEDCCSPGSSVHNAYLSSATVDTAGTTNHILRGERGGLHSTLIRIVACQTLWRGW